MCNPTGTATGISINNGKTSCGRAMQPRVLPVVSDCAQHQACTNHGTTCQWSEIYISSHLMTDLPRQAEHLTGKPYREITNAIFLYEDIAGVFE